MASHSLKKFTIQGWFLSYAVLMPGLALGQQPAGWVAQANKSDSPFRSRLEAAARLYEELEYEQALKEFDKARRLASNDDELVEVRVYEGIVLADLGQRPKALKAFREALSLRPDADLPIKVSPKVARDFEDLRAKARSNAAPLHTQEPSPARAEAEDRPILAPQDASEAASSPPQPVEPAPLTEMRGTVGPPKSAGLRVQPLPLALLGAGVVAGGVGSYFGLRSRSNIQSAREALFVDEQARYLDSARGQALGANVLFGIAVTAAVGAVTTYLLTDENSSSRGTP
ncbi:tetratricopeptide repeat protein [Myxococcus hansupus]|uniref:tetratricopeptide repeat protein n=1 Tax=Pseudomyxococcus hansupus TaxID=1297742 RepID=UPI0006760B09|nr:tetratricopeptide repeat protein [Myxococcus hansupus]